MKNKGAKQKLKRKGATSAFGCDLTEYLESSGQDGNCLFTIILFREDSRVQEFGSDQCPDLTREIYLQDIHCVGSLCKLYFRELPNPLLTYELYKKFTEAVSCYPEEEQLAQIQNVIEELPPSHYRTLEYLIKHLTHLASFSNVTNMHSRNLALVWAPNLLRSKETEAIGCNGDAAFLEVRVQQLVIEFILNHVDEIFNNIAPSCKENDDNKPIIKSLTLPSASLPMKLVSLEEAQARSLSACHPARKERRENSLPEIVPVTGSFFHTVLDLPDSKRKLSTKSKKWKSIFNLGRSGSESKSKLSRNGSVFVRGPKLSEKVTIRPAKSMDSLCSLPVEGEDEKGRFKRTVTAGGFFIPVMKIRTGGTGSSGDLSKQESEWDHEGPTVGAEGGSEVSGERAAPRTPQARLPPEQLKVFRAAEDPESEQISPKMCRMFYTSSDGPAKSGFPSSLFPVEASPRHQRKALNISEPFAVSVPLRVSAVISVNSTPCRVPTKDKPALCSLEESSFLGLDSSISTAPEGDSHTRSEPVLDREENRPAPKPRTGKTSGSRSPPMELLWPEIQQELKIIESEEELLFPPTASPETGQNKHTFAIGPEFSDSPQANSLSCGSALAPAPSKQEGMARNTQATSLLPLCPATASEGSKDPGGSGEAELVRQHNPTSNLPKLENVLYRTTQPKNCLVLEDTTRDLPLQLQDSKPSSEPQVNMGLSRNESSCPKGMHFEDALADPMQNLEMVEPWEDHQWVTSPLHSPTLKDIQEKGIQEFQPQSHRAEKGFFHRPVFSRSFSLDSKDSLRSLWTIPLSFPSTAEERPHRHESSEMPQITPHGSKEAERVRSWLSQTDCLSTDRLLSSEACSATGELPSKHEGFQRKPKEKEVDRSKESPEGLEPELPLPQLSTTDSCTKTRFSQTKNTEENPSRPQEAASTGNAVAKEPQINRGEDASHKARTRPSSLNLDSVFPAPNFFKFECVAVSVPPENLLCGQKEAKSSDSAPSLPAAFQAGNKADPWRSHFDPQELDLDYMAVAHATTGRRNSAPVSVSAVRTSFMIKLCQARAVPVIPPKIQYTQIPQPLQALDTNHDASPAPEKKEPEANTVCKPTHRAREQPEPPMSLQAEKKAKEEKENSDPAQMDSAFTRRGSLNPPPDPPLPNGNSTQEAPVLRRKRTSAGEATGDNPQSSKIERPSGFSKPSYRSRPGRPQSLILFSPPFPIMDHPSSSADSRMLLSPIRSPSQTTSPGPLCGDLSGTEGVTLRNKMTIPKNGQRLETSTSCFYQPQRRSVILDGRSGRQIE
uniref:Rho GTPase activating protein 31 n=1 Tax=Sphenodon punctatus TaxID=8508 RepID=A0A8D0GME9_SPHPU